MGMILRIASSRIVGQGDIVGRSGYFSLNLSANSVMRGRLDARRTLKSLVADLRINKDNISDLSKFNYPYKAEAFTLCIVLKGWVKGKINSIEYNAIAPCVISIYPNQILQHDSNSEDFYIICIAFTKNFASNIASYSKNEILLLRFPRQDNISHHLSQETLTALLDYCAYIKKIIADTDNPFRIKSIQHLTVALFYSTVWKQISSYKKKRKDKSRLYYLRILRFGRKKFQKI